MPRILFLLAHPDDEFACSMHIRDARRRGLEVHCVYLTDGAFGGQSARLRMEETTCALALLGIEPSSIHFLGSEHELPDGSLHAHMGSALTGLSALFDRIGEFESIYLPAWEGGHQDHDATHLIGTVAARRHGVADMRQFPLYNGAGLPGPFFNVLSPLPTNGVVDAYSADLGERLLAIRLCLVHRSQWRSWVGLLPLFAWKMLFGGRFPIQRVDSARRLEPAHPGRLLYERRGALDAEAFFAEAREFLRKNGVILR
jgi:N-acetylglucosamine malate deacetylase 1